MLFGRVSGRRVEPGLIAAAHRGTLVLHRIEDLPPRTQARLLRLAAEGSYLPVGAVRPVPVELRLISTSLPDPEAGGRLRPDLLHRLGGARLRMPRLCDRQDRLGLAERLICGPEGRLTLAPEALAALAAHDWPGNLRELAHLGTTLRATLPDCRVDLADLPDRLRHSARSAPLRPLARGAVLAQVLRETGGNVSEAARRLGVNRSTVHRQIRRLDPGR